MRENYEKCDRLKREVASTQFLSHEWISKFFEEDLFPRFLLADINELCETNIPLFTSLSTLTPTLSSDMFHNIDVVKRWKSTVKYHQLLAVSNIHTIRQKIQLRNFLGVLDFILYHIVSQEPIKRIAENYQRENVEDSFLKAKRNLITLRNDIEIASVWLSTSATHVPKYQSTLNAVSPHVGRVFYVQKLNGIRIISQTGSGVIANTSRGKQIITCRHFADFDEDKEIEIYFIPNTELDPAEYLPTKRMTDSPDEVDWEKYLNFQVIRMLIKNTRNMTSKVIFSGGYIQKIDSDGEFEFGNNEDDEAELKDLKKIRDTPENNDVMFLSINNPTMIATLGIDLVDSTQQSQENGGTFAAGYPSAGLGSRSLALVGSSASKVYKDTIDGRNPKLSNPDFFYKLSDIPAIHGMSGCGVFTVQGGRLLLLGILKGIDFETCGTLYSKIPQL